jgi:hypothetical protein
VIILLLIKSFSIYLIFYRHILYICLQEEKEEEKKLIEPDVVIVKHVGTK